MFRVIHDTIVSWYDDKAPRLGAALAYYAAFSIAPLLVIAIAVAGLVFGEAAAQGQIVEQVRDLIGDEGATALQSMIENTGRRPQRGMVATLLGIATLLFGASGVFGELQDSLNTILGAKPRSGSGVLAIVRGRFLSFAMVLGIAFLLLVSLLISAALSALGKMGGTLIAAGPLQVLNFLIAFVVISTLFAAIFKFLPDTDLAWRDVWPGAALTSLLFSVGKFAIGLYLGKTGVASAFGAAGSLAIILIWVYYSAQILFLGAEFTKAYARRQTRTSDLGNAQGLAE